MTSFISGTPPNLSSSLTNGIRDVSDIWTAVLKRDKGILSLLKEESRDTISTDGKFEWIEAVYDYEYDTLANGGAVADTDTTFKVANPARFKTNMIIMFRGYYETMRVIAVDTITGLLTVTRSYNTIAAPASVADLTIVDIINRPEFQNSRAHENPIFEHTIQYNYFEILREDIPFSENLVNTAQYGYATPEAYVNEQLLEFMNREKNRLNRSVMFGERYAESIALNRPATMRGIYTWLRQASTNSYDASTSALTARMINDRLEEIYQDDSAAGSVVMLMDVIQARVLSTFNTAVANQLKTVNFNETAAAGVTAVTQFQSDFNAAPNVTIIVDKAAPAGTLAFLNTNKIKLVYAPNGKMYTKDTTPVDLPTGAKRTMVYAQVSLEMRDSLYSHALIYNAKKTL